MSAMRCLIVLSMSLLVAPSWAQELGRDYTRLTLPQTPDTPDKIEVLEFFSWGCSHCADLFPLISEWEKQLPQNAVLVKAPISLGHPQWGQLVRAYYALEAMGELKRLEGAVFEAIHQQKQPLFNEDAIAAWVAKQGVNEQKFRTEFNSFNVSTKASRAEQLSRNYRINQTPQLAVDGKYLVLGKTHAEALGIARQLIEKAAAEKKTAQGT
ncbi:MAG: thiol:disulfide interchange protein DsbA/DsbL [Steroidobacter sp.]